MGIKRRQIAALAGLVALTLSLSACPGPESLKAVLIANVLQGEAPLTVTFHLSKSIGPITGFLLEFGDGETYVGEDTTIPVRHTYTNPGTYTATLTVWTANGRESTDSLDITVTPPIIRAVLNASPQYGYVPLEVEFDASESVGNIVEFTLDFGDGDSVTKGGDELLTPIVHTYGDPGTYTATLTVRDQSGNADTQSVTIHTEFPPLEAVLVADPTEGDAPLNVLFDLSGSAGEIIRFVLSFGDGQVITGSDVQATVTHTYSQPGTYHASLTVVDSYGQSDTASLRIEAR